MRTSALLVQMRCPTSSGIRQGRSTDQDSGLKTGERPNVRSCLEILNARLGKVIRRFMESWDSSRTDAGYPDHGPRYKFLGLHNEFSAKPHGYVSQRLLRSRSHRPRDQRSRQLQLHPLLERSDRQFDLFGYEIRKKVVDEETRRLNKCIPCLLK